MALLAGHGPFAVVAGIWRGAWGGTGAAADTVVKLPPLLLTGLAVALAYRVGLLNIGCEGQLTLGALAAAAVGVTVGSLPGPPAVLFTLAASLAMGALWAWPAVWLKRRRGVHEVITTILLNYTAIYLADYLVRGPLGDGTAMARTPEIARSAVLGPWWQAGTQGITAAPLLALVLTFAAQFWLARTVWGYEAKTCGANPLAASMAGIGVHRWQTGVFVASGALAGLAGGLEVVAVHHRFYGAFSPGYGFDGITVAFLVNAVPGWTWLSGLLLASLRATDKWLQLMLGISPNAVFVLEAVLLLAVACRFHPLWGARLPGALRRLTAGARSTVRENGSAPGSGTSQGS
jgi:simple sugar transport system permease protein